MRMSSTPPVRAAMVNMEIATGEGESEHDHDRDHGGTETGIRRALSLAWRVTYRFLLIPSLADRLAPFMPLYQALVFSPLHTLVLVLCLYVLNMVVWFPLYALSYLITTPGVYCFIASGIYYTGRLIARSLSYPGNMPTVLRDIEYEYSSQMVRKLEQCSVKLKEWVADLRVVFNATTPTPHPMLGRHHIEVCFIRKHMLGVLVEALRSITSESKLSTELRLSESAAKDARQLLEVVERVVLAIDNVMPTAHRVVSMHAQGMPQSFKSISMYPSATTGPSPRPPPGGDGEEGMMGPSVLSTLRYPGGNQAANCTTTTGLAAASPGPCGLGGSACAGGGNGAAGSGTANSGMVYLEALVEAADQVQRVAPLFRRDRSADQGMLGMMKHWARSKKPWDNVLGSFLMREELCHRLKARQVWVTGSDGVKLDCCFIPAQRLHPSTGKSLGIVLYCNPNAGHYECFTHAPFSSDWVDLYTSLGCDMFLFNYRGYGRSTGKANPHAINRDAEMIVRYLRGDMGYTRIAVHGESIGGMVACHVARACEGVELLVADRTFCTLAAVADRLVASWAGKAMHFFTGWETDVVSDFVAAPCYKVVCSDPNDQIIADAASLKVGIAVRRELGDTRHRVLRVSTPYIVAESQGSSPCAALEGKVVSAPASPDERLSERQLEHFAACLRYLARRAKQQDLGLGADGEDPRGSRLNVATRLLGGKGHFDTDSEVSEMEDSDDDRESMASSPGPGCMSPLQPPLQLVWRTVARCDGLGAQMLGQAVANSFESVRAWTCCLVQWGPQMILENSNSVRRDFPSALPLQSVRMALEDLMERHGPAMKGAPEAPELDFVVAMVRYLDDRVGHDLERLVEDQHQALNEGRKERLQRSTEAAGLIGHLVPLQCGHNASFSELERERFLYHLSSQGWVIDSFDDL